MEREVGRKRLTFLTLTLPDISEQESKDVGRNWSSIVRVFVQKLRRHLTAVGLPSEVLGVTEIQPRRTNRDGVLGLHLHLVFAGRKDRSGWLCSPTLVRTMWQTTILPYLHEASSAYDWRAVENMQQVRKSAADYLGKYISKGVGDLKKAAERFGEDSIPSSWYTITETLRARTLASVRLLSNQSCSDLIYALSCLESPFFHYSHPVVLSSPNCPDVVIGWHGRIKDEYISLFVEMV